MRSPSCSSSSHGHRTTKSATARRASSVSRSVTHTTGVVGVPARLGKGRGAKEIGRNLARERPKFGHNLACERYKIGHSLEREQAKFGHNPVRERIEIWAQFCGRSMKTWAQFCKQFTVHRLSENTKTAIIYVKKKGNCYFCIQFSPESCSSRRSSCSTAASTRSALPTATRWRRRRRSQSSTASRRASRWTSTIRSRSSRRR